MAQPQILLADLAFPAIERSFGRMLKERSGVESGKDTRAVHDFRVALRRLRAALEVFGPGLDLPKAGSARTVARFGRRFRALRDHDVLLEWLDAPPATPPAVAERVELHRIAGVLRERREAALAEARAAFRSRAFSGMRRGLSAWLARPAWRWPASLRAGDTLPDLLSPVLRRFWLHPGWGIGAVLRQGRLQVAREDPGTGPPADLDAQGETLHQLRRIGKRLRYQVEPLVDVAGPGTVRRLEQLRRLQSVLGRLQDAQVLARTLNELCEGAARRRLPVLWEHLEEQGARAWADWRPLQRHFVRPDARLPWRLLGRT